MILMVLDKCNIGTFTYVRHSKHFLFCSLISDKALWFSSIFMNMEYANFIFCIFNAD